ncbi:MAG: hypothetical protein ACI841_003924 [Planctomycetota bacterium]|jgi:hypothetical protein
MESPRSVSGQGLQPGNGDWSLSELEPHRVHTLRFTNFKTGGLRPQRSRLHGSVTLWPHEMPASLGSRQRVALVVNQVPAH